MSTLWECIMDAANETETGVPSSGSVPTSAEYIRWANRVQDEITNQTQCLEKRFSFPLASMQTVYTPGDEFIRPAHVEYQRGTSSLYSLNYDQIAGFRQKQAFSFYSGVPIIYTIFNKNLEIFPPTAGSAFTGATSGATTSAATSLSFIQTSLTDQWSNRGVVKLGGVEEVEYTGLSVSGGVATITGLRRGVSGTTPAVHSSGASVQQLNLWMWGYCRYLSRPMNIWTTGTATFTSGSAIVSAGSTAPYWASNVNSGDSIGIGNNPSKWYKITSVGATIGIDSNYAEASSANAVYTISSTSEMPTQYHPLLTDYMIYRTWMRLEETQKAAMKKAELDEKMASCRVEMVERGGEYGTMRDVNWDGPMQVGFPW